MPPRPSLSLCWSCRTSLLLSRSFRPSPFAQTQARAASILSSLSDVRGAYNKKIRRGRGPASGKGKTSGRGHKGQKQHGKVPAGFNGGQTTLEKFKGERGFKPLFSAELSKLNLDTLQSWIDQGRLDAKKPITLLELATSRCIHGVKKDGVKLLGRNADQLKTPVNIVVTRASASAIAAVEATGGTVTTRFYTPFGIQRIMKGLTNPLQGLEVPGAESDTTTTSKFRYRLPDPTSRKDIEYYRDPAHRGYLSHTLKEGEGPSLFWNVPGMGKTLTAEERKRKAAQKSENSLW